MPRLTKTAPPRLMHHEVVVASEDPLVFTLTLDTDDGTFEILVNRSGALALAETLAETLRSAED